MPETLLVNDFRSGWCPSDDIVNARPNALLQMDNLELDRNGALTLVGGSQVIQSGYSAPAHTLYSRFLGTTRHDYAALTDGSVWRDNASIITGGDGTNAAFGTAFNYVLICSGTKRFKDTGTALQNLGVGAPTSPPTVTTGTYSQPVAIIGNYTTQTVVHAGSVAIIGSGASTYIQCTSDTYGWFVLQTYPPPGPALDTTQLSGGAGGCAGTATDDDVVIINGYAQNYVGMSFEFDVLLQPGDSAGDPPQDMYSYTINDMSTGNVIFDNNTGVFTVTIRRVDFSLVGSGLYGWQQVYGFRLVVHTPAAGGMINIWGVQFGVNVFQFRGGSAAQNGTYQYMQVNVNNTGSYLAKSEKGPSSNPIALNNVNALITYQPPTDPQVNQVWIFRNGGNLGGTWYRVAVVNAPFNSPYQLYDCTGDQAALDLNITYDINLKSIANITDKVYDIVGPVQGRWYYFTTNFMYPSDINDPDLVNVNLAVRICGSTAELLMWARPVSASVVIVGTSIDCYLLTGTFTTFPDGSIDSYYQSLGVKFPPVTYDAMAYGGAIYYYANDGWRMVLPTSFGTTYSSQNNQSMTSPNTDRLYRGETTYNYAPPPLNFAPGTVRMPVTIGRNKLWCCITGTARCEVYDFVRQYWYTFNFQLGDISAITTTQEGRVFAFYKNDLKLREIGSTTTKLVDAATKQSFKMIFPYKDNGKPRQRKDTYTFKSRLMTGQTGSMTVQLISESNQSFAISQTLSSYNTTTEQYVDLSQPMNVSSPYAVLPKSYLCILSGSAEDFFLEDWSIDYDARPNPLSYLKIYPNNLGSATQKRMRTWPLVIDTLGNVVVFTPNVDGANQPPTTFITNGKRTVYYFFTTDVFGVDYGGTLYDANGLMEVWDTGLGGIGGGVSPNIVQNLPMPTQFDQVGPLEIFRWGKVLRMGLRCYSTGGPIPFQVFMSDGDIWDSTFPVVGGVEDEYIVDLPKGTSGRIIRVVLGPTSFTFNRYYLKLQVAISGRDTELQWLTYPGVTSTLAGGI